MLRLVGGAAAPWAENAPLGHRCLLVTPESAPAPIRLHSICFARVRSRARPKRATSTSASNLQSAEFHAAVAATSPASPSSGFERDLKTVIPTHLPERVPVECKIFAGACGGFAVPGAGVFRGEECGDAGDGHPGARSGRVHRGVPEVADEAGEVDGAAADCSGCDHERWREASLTGTHDGATDVASLCAVSPPLRAAEAAREQRSPTQVLDAHPGDSLPARPLRMP